MKIFIDSSFLIALINENDSLHEKSLQYLDLIEKNDCYIIAQIRKTEDE